MGHGISRADKFGAILASILLFRDVGSVNFIPYFAVHPGQRYENVTLESKKWSLGSCSAYCVLQNPSHCYAFNYRGTDGSCQLVVHGNGSLVDGNGHQSYVRSLCLGEPPTIPNALISYGGWNGSSPAPEGGMVTLRCENPKGFTDGASLHAAECALLRPDSWWISFHEGAVRCEKQHTYPECLLTEKGREYMGRANATESGRECLPWRAYPHSGDSLQTDSPGIAPIDRTYENSFLNWNSVVHRNYCRNPSGKERPWCFVSDPAVRWEYCYVPMCTDLVPPECKLTEPGGEYGGRKNATITGRQCLPWRGFEEEVDLSSLPDADGVDSRHNFCRNPGLREFVWVERVAPWCYVEAGSPPTWEYCDVSFCKRRVEIGVEGRVYPECRLTEKGIEYVGSRNESETGRECKRWSADTKRLQELTYPYSLSFYDLPYSLYPKNHCRNTGQFDRPWCLVSDRNTLWEYCDIPVCTAPNPPECKLSRPGVEYVGKLNVTISGYPCKPWLEVCARSPDACEQVGSRLPDELDGNHRFCRSNKPTFHGPRCFTDSDGGPEWEYCDVPFCPPADGQRCDVRVDGRCISPLECKVDKRGRNYIGTKNSTRNGFRCQAWLSNSPNDQLLIIDYDESNLFYFDNSRGESEPYQDPSTFPDDLDSRHNYCRNPNDDEELWCFKADGVGRDYCDVPDCP